jgi:undecaprenyl-diphosphatase
MDPVQAIILGIIQGLTEFLPVSSSGHLVIFQHVFGLKEPELFFDIFVHIGTLLAVMIVFREEIRELLRSLGLFLGLNRELSARYSFMLAIPAILGAGILSLHGLMADPNVNLKIALIGAAVSFVVGYFALVSLMHLVKKAKLYLFAPYRWAAGIAALFFVWR